MKLEDLRANKKSYEFRPNPVRRLSKVMEFIEM